MICQKCGTEIQINEPFCPNCGARVDEKLRVQSVGGDGIKPRKDYNTVIYVVLSWFVGSLWFGIGDFYAGFYKMGIYRVVAPILGFAIAIGSINAELYPLAIPGLLIAVSSLFIGIFELCSLSRKAVMLENGQVEFVRYLDLAYDKKGVDKAMYLKHGCGLAPTRR